MEQALSHADQVSPAWRDRAYEVLKAYVEQHPHEQFFGEDVREWAYAQGDLPEPPHARAWGGIIAKAAKAGVIVQHGIGQVKNPKAHRANAAIWMKG